MPNLFERVRDEFLHRVEMGLFSRGYGFGTENQGGVYNPATGAGTGVDTVRDVLWEPTILADRWTLDAIYYSSWTAWKAVDIPIDDMLVRWRGFKGDDEHTIEMMEKAEQTLKVKEVVREWGKAARLYGSAWIIPLMQDATLDQPLAVDMVRPGDITKLYVVDRFNCQPKTINRDRDSEYFGEPEYWTVGLHDKVVTVHTSRMLRGDGVPSFTSYDSYGPYYPYFGHSVLERIKTEVDADAQMAAAVASAVSEMNAMIMKVQGLSAGSGTKGEGQTKDMRAFKRGYEKIVSEIRRGWSRFRMLVIDSKMEILTNPATLAGVEGIQNFYMTRVAAAADITEGRFYGKSPTGLLAHADDEMTAHALGVGDEQQRLLEPCFTFLDPLLAAHMGLAEAPEYTFMPLRELSDLDRATVLNATSQALANLIRDGVIDDAAARRYLEENELLEGLEDQDYLHDEFGNEPEPPLWPPGMPMPPGMKTQEENDAEEPKSPGAVPNS